MRPGVARPRCQCNSNPTERGFQLWLNATQYTAHDLKIAKALDAIRPPAWRINTGTILHGLDDFYSNHPEAIKASVGEVLLSLPTAGAAYTCDGLIARVKRREGAK